MSAVGRSGWQTADIATVVPAAVGRQMIRRAEQFDVEAGGRFDVRMNGTVYLWSRDEHPDGGRGAPVGLFRIRWAHPTPEHATIYRLAWDPDACSLDELRRAIDVLRGDSSP
jgi:hypothetical protein